MTKYNKWNINIENVGAGMFRWVAKKNDGSYLADKAGGELGTKAHALWQIKEWINTYESGFTGRSTLRMMGLTVV